MTIDLLNTDCMKFMADVPMGYFDLVIADPPYGIGRDWERRNKASQQFSETYDNTERPSPEVFNEIIRVSKHWVIWGWNYFTDILPPSNYLIVWDKMSNCNQTFHYSKAEIAGTDIKIPCNLVAIPWDGYRMGEETGQKKNPSAPEAGRALSLAPGDLRTQGEAHLRSVRRFWKSRYCVQAARQGLCRL